MSSSMEMVLGNMYYCLHMEVDPKDVMPEWVSILGINYSLFEKLTEEKCIREKRNKERGVIFDEKIEDLREILLQKPGLVVLDQRRTPRNRRSNIWNDLLKLQTGKRVIGTPFHNNFVELSNTLHLVRPAIGDVLMREKTFSGIIISPRGLDSKRKSDGNKKISEGNKDEYRMNLGVASCTRSKTIIQKHLEVGAEYAERIDEGEFRKLETDSAAASGENVLDRNKIISAEKKDECRMSRADLEMNLGSTSRTRSKTTTKIQKNIEVGEVSFDSSNDSSSSSDSGYDTSNDDFEVENSNSSDSSESCSIVPSAEIPMVTRNEEGTSYERTRVPGNQFKRKRGSSYDLFRRLADSVLERGPMVENDETNAVPQPTPEEKNQSPLPLKFRFEDEVLEQVEKTDFEKEMEGLFEEARFCSTFEELDFLNCPEVDQEPEKSPVTETQDAQCARGQHEFIIQDDAGVICKKCLHEAIGPKDIMPEWAKSTRRGSRRKRSPTDEDISPFDEFHLASPVNEHAAFNSNRGTVWKNSWNFRAGCINFSMNLRANGGIMRTIECGLKSYKMT